jgi:hypothetical protein
VYGEKEAKIPRMLEVQAEDAACPITTSVGNARYDEQEGSTAIMAGE